MSRFVKPDVTTIAISGGDVLTVKTRLSYGERVDAYEHIETDDKGQVRARSVALALVMAYLVDWTLKDDDGVVVPIRGVSSDELRSTLRALDPDDFAEIREAIELHEERIRTARESQKKTPTGALASSAT